MKINRLKMKNFGVVSNADIKPDKGINLISGRNGEGKSTIIEALSILLFNSARDSFGTYIQWGKKKYELFIDFEHLGKKFIIEYEYSNSAKRKVQIDDKVWDDNTSAVQQLNKYFDSSMTIVSMFSFQGKNSLIDTKPSERREFLKNVFNYSFESQIKEIDEEIKEIKDIDIVDLDKKIYFLENKEYDIKKLNEIEYIKEDIEKKEARLELLNVEISSLEKDIENFETVKNDFKSKNLKQLEINDKIEKIKKDISDYEVKKEKLIESLESQEKSLEESPLLIKTKYNDKEKEISSRIDSLENKIKELSVVEIYNTKKIDDEYEEKIKKELELKNNFDDKLKDLKLIEEKKLPCNEEEYQEKLMEAQKINFKIQAIKKEIKLIEEGNCPTCKRPFKDVNKIDKEKEKDSLENELKSKKEFIDQYKILIEENKEIFKKNNDINEIIAGYKNDIAKADNTIKNYENELEIKKEAYKKEIDTLNERNKKEAEILKENIKEEKNKIDNLSVEFKLEIEKENNRVKELIKSLEENIDSNNYYIRRLQHDLKDRLDEVSIIEKEILLIKDKIEGFNIEKEKESLINKSKELKEIETILKDYEFKVKENERIEKENEGVLNRKEKDNKLKENYIENKNELNKKLECLKESKIIFQKTFPNYLLQSVIMILEKGMYNFVNSIYDKDYPVKFIDDHKGSIKIQYGDHDADISKASGFEKGLFSLAYKDTLNKMQKIDFMVLDEADKDADNQNSEDVYRFLADSLSNYNQIFIITHKPEIKEMLESEYSAKVFNVHRGVISE